MSVLELNAIDSLVSIKGGSLEPLMVLSVKNFFFFFGPEKHPFRSTQKVYGST